MGIVSYAQNREDVVLARALGDVAEGFYVDVGAADPVIASVTKHFADRGWTGINVEPNLIHAARLRDERPRDVNLEIGIGDAPGELVFYELSDLPDCSTFDPDLAATYRSAGEPIREYRRAIRTLDDVLEEFAVRPIDFLKLDVEGLEASAVQGCDWERWHPSIVVVEATHPNTTVASSAEWEPVLVRAGYQFALFDGLSRFYAPAERADLLERLSYPACVLDDYEPYDLSWTRVELERTRTVVLELQRQLEARGRELQAIRQTRVMRYSAPLRRLYRGLRTRLDR